MRRNFLRMFLVGAGLLVGAGTAASHHSVSAEFDPDQPIAFTGTVVQVDWLNPHIYTHVEVEQPDGTKVTYKVEGGAPNTLFRRGWRPDTLKAGDVVAIVGIRARNPQSPNVGRATITLADGTTVYR